MERQKTDTNVSVSKAEAKRFCKDELKRQKETGSSPSASRSTRREPGLDAPTDPPPAAPPSDPPAG